MKVSVERVTWLEDKLLVKFLDQWEYMCFSLPVADFHYKVVRGELTIFYKFVEDPCAPYAGTVHRFLDDIGMEAISIGSRK
jgi:hypothetical protein